jgi:hypothetical protein
LPQACKTAAGLERRSSEVPSALVSVVTIAQPGRPARRWTWARASSLVRLPVRDLARTQAVLTGAGVDLGAAGLAP